MAATVLPRPVSVNAAVNDTIIESIEYWKVRHAVKEHLTQKEDDSEMVGDTIKRFLEQSGQALQMQNLAFALQERLVLPYDDANSADLAALQTLGQSPLPDSTQDGAQSENLTPDAEAQLPLDDSAEPKAMKQLREQWQSIVVDRLMEVKDSACMPLARRQRDASMMATLRCSGLELASERIGRSDGTSTFTSSRVSLVKTHIVSNDLLLDAVVCALKGTALRVPVSSAKNLVADVASLPERAPSTEPIADSDWRNSIPNWTWLLDFFEDLHPRYHQVGVDEEGSDGFRSKSLAQAQAVLSQGSIPNIRKYLRRGAPPSCRAHLWDTALSLSNLSYRDIQHFEQLCERVEERDLLTDILLEKDLQAFLLSEDFFIFEDQIRACMLAFSRDASITTNASAALHPRLVGIGRGGHRHGSYPPNGVLPFEGATAYAAPMMYVYKHTAAMFRGMRVLFCRYWCNLHCLSSVGLPSPCMPVLAATFEQVLQRIEPDLVQHLVGLGCLPISIALPWMASAFVGDLNVREVLHLWDRVVGFDSLLVLPILAVGILSWRCKLLMQCSSSADVAMLLSDLSELKVVPLLQAVLFLSPSNL